MDLSVVIPAYQEKENLEILLPKLIGVLSGMRIQFEILVIDTMEKLDSTEEVCRLNKVDYVHRENGDRYGDAIRTGIQRSAGDKVLIMDADGSHKPESIAEMYPYSGGYDVVIGSRYVKNGKTENSPLLIMMSLMVNIVYRVALNIKVKDVSNSFRIYDGSKLRNIETVCNDFDLVEELLIKLSLQYPELTVKEVPTEFKKRLYGRSKRDLIKFAFSYLLTMNRLLKIMSSFRKNKANRQYTTSA